MDLTIITGAGFAQGLGGLSVRDIDEAFDRLPRREYNQLEAQWSVSHRRAFESLVQILRGRYGEAYNFELLLSALRDMLPFRRQTLGLFTATLTSVAALNGWDAEVMLDVHEVVVCELINLVESRAIPATGVKLATAQNHFQRLVDLFQVTHCDLNYDDFSETVYEPGATDAGFGGDSWPRPFNAGSFVRSKARVRLMHQHGSYRFRYDRQSGFVQLKTGTTRTLPSSADTIEGLRYESLISGTAKASQLMPMPFVVYYHTFGNAVLHCPRILIVGYGGSDLHLNTLLVHMKEIHGNELRVVWIYQGDLINQTTLMRSLCAVYAGETNESSGFALLDSLEFDDDGFAESGSLLLYNCGFPCVRGVDHDRIVTHLAG